MSIGRGTCEKAQPSGPWKRRPSALIAAFFFLFALAACINSPSKHGMNCLEPIPGEGFDVLNTQYEKDTLRFTQNRLAISAHGKWGGTLTGISVRVEIFNNMAVPMRVDLEQFDLVEVESKEYPLSYPRGFRNLPRSATVKSGERRAFTVGADIRVEDGRTPDAEQILGSKVALHLPIILHLQTGEKTNWIFMFKYVECPKSFL